MSISASDILSVTKSVTKEWTKQRKSEERGRQYCPRAYAYSDRVNFTDVAESILPVAYKHASGDGKYPVAKRQLYYACRESFYTETGRELDSQYFSNVLLVQYINRHNPDWKITADPRGTFCIPNADYEVRIPCGTLAIEEYLRGIQLAKQWNPEEDLVAEIPVRWPSLKPGHRYQGVLYIEKEGFEPLLKEARIAERFDLATLSCKGQSVVAARQLVDEVCQVLEGVPLFVVHDFDKSGFEISQRLTTVSQAAQETDRVAYHFRNEINVTDFGLRLEDVRKYTLASESVKFKGRFAPDSIATDEEKEFLRSGRRVELNAFTSPEFIEWLENKLIENGLGKRLIPEQETLEAAYRRALAVAEINKIIEEAADQAQEDAENADIPTKLKAKLQRAMKKHPTEAWDRVLYRIAQEEIS